MPRAEKSEKFPKRVVLGEGYVWQQRGDHAALASSKTGATKTTRPRRGR